MVAKQQLGLAEIWQLAATKPKEKRVFQVVIQSDSDEINNVAIIVFHQAVANLFA